MDRSISKHALLACTAAALSLVLGACTREKINIEKSLLDKVLVEFSEERLAHYLKGEDNGWQQRPRVQLQVRHVDRFVERRPRVPSPRARRRSFHETSRSSFTRFTPAKHAAQASPYRHLLKPKIGGLGIALATMGEQFEALLDVTIVYPQGAPTFWALLCGHVDAVTVRVQQRPIPADVLGGDPQGDKAYRQRIGAWVEAQWAEKDALIDALLERR